MEEVDDPQTVGHCEYFDVYVKWEIHYVIWCRGET